MPLKIRCPHCQTVLRAQDDTLGEERRCPVCGRIFTVPLPERLAPERAPLEVGVICPRCSKTLAPGASVCRRCATDLSTGKRLPLAQRWRLLSTASRVWLGAAALMLIMAVPVALQLSLTAWRQSRSAPSAAATSPVPVIPIEPMIEKLLVGDESAAAAVDELASIGPRAMPALAEAARRQLDRAASRPAEVRGLARAIEVFARVGPTAAPAALPVLEQCDSIPSLRSAAMEARGALADVRIAPELQRAWLERLRRRIFLESLRRSGQFAPDAALQEALRSAQVECDRATRALRPLVLNEKLTVLDEIVECYWSAAAWLGNHAGEAFAAAVFDLARPPLALESAAGMTFGEESRSELQAARRNLVRVAERAPAATRAAAGLILLAVAPQQKSARERIVKSLIELLPECSPADQQRVAWSVARLNGRSFGALTPATPPSHVRHEDVRAVLRWAESSGTARPGPLRSGPGRFPPPLRVERQVVTGRRLLEADLLGRFQDWSSQDAALSRWHAEKLGVTPRIEALLDPRQRAPNEAALAAAMTLAPLSDDPRVRQMLELWSNAVDQPAWVPALARTALAAAALRRGQGAVSWPDGVLLDARMLAAGTPGYDHFARVIAVGGAAMTRRLESDASLPEAVRRQLLTAIERSRCIEEPGGGR